MLLLVRKHGRLADFMPSNILVAIFVFFAAASLLFTPMPWKVRILLSVTFLYTAVVYMADAVGWITAIEQKQTLARWAWVVLSSVITLSVITWRLGAKKCPSKLR